MVGIFGLQTQIVESDPLQRSGIPGGNVKSFNKLAVLCAVLALSSSAFAASITGSVTISGLDTYNATGITFNPTTATVLLATGTLAPYTGASVGLNSFQFATANGTELFFSPSTGTTTMTFTINGPVTVVHDDSSFLNVTGFGTFTENGFDATPGTFNLTSTANGNVSFTLDSSVPTPEPSSLMLMGSGLVSAAGMFMRRRRVNA